MIWSRYTNLPARCWFPQHMSTDHGRSCPTFIQPERVPLCRWGRLHALPLKPGGDAQVRHDASCRDESTNDTRSNWRQGSNDVAEPWESGNSTIKKEHRSRFSRWLGGKLRGLHELSQMSVQSMAKAMHQRPFWSVICASKEVSNLEQLRPIC